MAGLRAGSSVDREVSSAPALQNSALRAFYSLFILMHLGKSLNHERSLCFAAAQRGCPDWAVCPLWKLLGTEERMLGEGLWNCAVSGCPLVLQRTLKPTPTALWPIPSIGARDDFQTIIYMKQKILESIRIRVSAFGAVTGSRESHGPQRGTSLTSPYLCGPPRKARASRGLHTWKVALSTWVPGLCNTVQARQGQPSDLWTSPPCSCWALPGAPHHLSAPKAQAPFSQEGTSFPQEGAGRSNSPLVSVAPNMQGHPFLPPKALGIGPGSFLPVGKAPREGSHCKEQEVSERGQLIAGGQERGGRGQTRR